jgi:glycosyltransferase involved in cell wall biosynthesis
VREPPHRRGGALGQADGVAGNVFWPNCLIFARRPAPLLTVLENRPRILHLSTYDGLGGAARACVRLHTGLREAGWPSALLTLDRSSPGIAAHATYNALPKGWAAAVNGKIRSFYYYRQLRQLQRGRPPGREFFSWPAAPIDVTQTPQFQQADILNLHYVSEFVDYDSFFAQLVARYPAKRVVWTMHDMSAFTGGCHHADECLGYQTTCPACPQLPGPAFAGWSQRILARKQAVLAKLPPAQLHLVSPSAWLKQQAEASRVFARFRHWLIPNGVDARVFRPIDQAVARQALGLPAHGKILLFVANSLANVRKGFPLLVQALAQLAYPADQLTLCAIGAPGPDLPPFRYPVLPLGLVADERLLALAYAAADWFVMPSLAENLPNVISESLLCGTPVVAFPRGGMVEMVQPDQNGHLCPEATPEALAATLAQALVQPLAWSRATIAAQAQARYDLPHQVAAYQTVYEQAMQG